MPLRLQLFRWRANLAPAIPAQAAVWPQYKTPNPDPYSATIYISILPIPPPAPLTVKYPFRPMAAHHREQGRLNPDDLFSARGGGLQPGGAGGYTGGWHGRRQTRGDAPCLVPNIVLHALPGGAAGVTAVAFSPNGELVVAALADTESAGLKVFDVGSGNQVRLFFL
jgi:hypothetical protein